MFKFRFTKKDILDEVIEEMEKEPKIVPIPDTYDWIRKHSNLIDQRIELRMGYYKSCIEIGKEAQKIMGMDMTEQEKHGAIKRAIARSKE